MRFRILKSLRLRYVIGVISVLMCVGVIAVPYFSPSNRGANLELARWTTIVYKNKTLRDDVGEVGYKWTKWRISWEPAASFPNLKDGWTYRPTIGETLPALVYDPPSVRVVVGFDRFGCSFRFYKITPRRESSRTGFEFAMPTWMLVVLTLLWPIYVVLAFIRRTKNPHACPTCGYDLRATPDRCPECGSRVTKTPDAAAEAADRGA